MNVYHKDHEQTIPPCAVETRVDFSATVIADECESDPKSYFLPRAFMSHNQEVRALMRPPIWSALPLFGSGTNNRMRVPAVMPRTGDT